MATALLDILQHGTKDRDMQTTLIERQALVAGLTVAQVNKLRCLAYDEDTFIDWLNQMAAFTSGRVNGWTDRYDRLLNLYLEL